MFKVKLIFLSGLLLLSSAAISGVTTSSISKILLYDGGLLVYVYPTDGVTNPPACHGANGDYYSFSSTRPMAKEYLTALLAAQARGASVTFAGSATCDDQSYSETLNYITVRAE